MGLLVATAGAAAAQAPGAPTMPACPAARVSATDPGEAQRTRRLVALAKLWGKAKLFHPSLAYKAIDWDAALLAAIPKVGAAADAKAFADAVQDMLAALGDPATRVVDTGQTPAPRPSPRSPAAPGELTPDGVLIVKLTDHADPKDWSGWKYAWERIDEVAKRLSDAKAVVLDLRSRDGQHPYGLADMIGASPFVRGSLDETVGGPGSRRRLYMGYPRQGDSGSEIYSSSFLVTDGRRFPAKPGAGSRPLVLLINARSPLPEIALALQNAGKAAIVSEGESSDAFVDLAQPLSIDLDGPFTALVRTSEPVWSDGTGGFRPDVVVPPAKSDREDPAIDAALRLAREFKVGKPSRPLLAGHGTLPRDASYADLASLSLEHRLLAAFRMHSVVQHFFPYRDIMGEDWDQVLGEFIPRFEAAADSMSYALCVAEMWTRTHDSHSFIDGAQLRQYFGPAQPPLRVRWIAGAVVVFQVLDASAVAPTGLKVGDVVLSIDGEEIGQRMARIGRHIAASAPHTHKRSIAGNLLGGPEGSAAKLRIRAADGTEREVEIARSVPRNSPLARAPWRGGEVLRWLPGDIGYADLDRLELAQVDALFEMFANAKAIVFDVRGYPKGTAWGLVQRLTDRPRVPAALFRQPRVWAGSEHFGRDALGDVTEFVQQLPPPRTDRPAFRGPTVLLIDERTQSQAEHTGLFLKAANGTLWIGSATAGANGDITTLVVPGGITLTFTGQAVRHPDGRQLQRIGLVPDLEVHPTIAGLRAGRDEVLEAAIARLEELSAK